MKRILLLVTILSFKICLAQNLEISNGWYYIDGEKFFVKGIGYETHTRPGQVPWIYKFDADLIRFDLGRIKSAGFNTIRTWGAITEDELKLVEESGLKILFGIWIDPGGDFGSQTFKTSTLNHVNSVLNYSNKYKCVIGYLIMNEPQVDQIYEAGAQNLFELWKSVIDLIHQKHPGIPVSFSNTIVGDYINMDIFDFAAYNAYIYNPVTITGSHGYGGFLSYLKSNRANQKPFIVTEFGLSVSPGTSSNEYTYGGNTSAQQTNGDLFMYRNLIDAGAQGGAVFQYHDGWWKGGNEFVHDSSPEEWFGLIEFASASDKYGTPRPVWNAFEKYNKAIITEPKNEKIYYGKIPVEIFTTNDVDSFSVSVNDTVVYNKKISSNYFSDSLSLNFNGQAKDYELTFDFYNTSGDTVKSEMISILRSKGEINLPEIKMQILNSNLNPGGRNYLLMEVTNDSLFTIEGNKIEYVFHPHIGFDEGTAKSRTITLINNKYTFSDYFDIPKETKAATFGAGFTIKHGNFSKRIFTQQILTHGTWANTIKANDVITEVDERENSEGKIIHEIKLNQNYPNPFNPSTTIEYTISNVETHNSAGGGASQQHILLKIYDILGREIAILVNEQQTAGKYIVQFNVETLHATSLPSGVYFYTLRVGNSSPKESSKFQETRKMIYLK